MRRALAFFFASLATASLADDSPAATTSIEADAPEELLVTGEFPGPGMWRVMRADDPENHVLWILGSPPPLPKKMKWKSKDVETAVLSSQEILLPSSVNVKPDEKIGFFKGLSLVPAALGARKNPEQQQLQDVLAPDVYTRWLPLKKEYLGRSNGVEKWRPIFAAYELRGEAFDDLKMRESGLVFDAVNKLAEKHKIKKTTPTLEFGIQTKNIKAKIKEFAREPLADQECFSTTLDLVEAISEHDTMAARATAWATGDLESLLALPPLPNPNIACQTAIMSSQIAQELIPSDIGTQLKRLWFEAAENSLAANQSTFAFLSMQELTSPDGQLAALRAKGYVIQEPKRD
jgi:TraB/PrgY/gumN family